MRLNASGKPLVFSSEMAGFLKMVVTAGCPFLPFLWEIGSFYRENNDLEGIPLHDIPPRIGVDITSKVATPTP